MTAPGSVANKLAKQKEQANAPVTSGPAPLSSFTPAGEDSEISTTMRSDGSIFEVRRFKSHPQLKSAESTWKLGEPKRVEGLPHEKFYNFAYSKDGKWFAFVRGQEIRDVVMISNSKD